MLTFVSILIRSYTDNEEFCGELKNNYYDKKYNVRASEKSS